MDKSITNAVLILGAFFVVAKQCAGEVERIFSPPILTQSQAYETIDRKMKELGMSPSLYSIDARLKIPKGVVYTECPRLGEYMIVLPSLATEYDLEQEVKRIQHQRACPGYRD